jgi:phospholipid-transporting ATPase
MEVNEHLLKLRNKNIAEQGSNVSIVVDGKTLIFALDHSLRKDFIELLSTCSSVICCRVSPLQKAEVVELVQQHTKSICLAIGDGANDVAMIQKAHVGVGISGNEGLQAANSSDFAIGQFRFLSRLLFLHGAWFYTRVSKVILYSFYKTICLYIIELWFAIYNAWTGQVLFERWTIALYNLVMTSIPPLAIGLFDRRCTEQNRVRYPALYRETQTSVLFNSKIFWKWVLSAILHSAILFWLPMFTFNTGIVWKSGANGGYLVVGSIIYSCVMVTVCLKAALLVDSWNWLIHLSIWGSLTFWFVFFTLHSFAWPLGNYTAEGMAGMVILVGTTPIFWLCIVLVPFTALMLDVTLMAINNTACTSKTDKIRLAEHARVNPDPYISDYNTDHRSREQPNLE